MNISVSRIIAITKKEFRHLRRDRLTGGMIAGIPIVMTILFGYAINNDVRGLNAAVVDEANTSTSRELVKIARATQVIDDISPMSSAWEIEQEMEKGKITVGIYIPPDFERRRALNNKPYAQLLINDSDPTILGTARDMANIDLNNGSQLREQETFAIKALYNPERRSAIFIVPGLCGVILTLTMVLFTSIAIVRERELGNLELLITTPLQSLELMTGKILPYVIIGYIQVTLILLLGSLLFDVPVRGSLTDFYTSVGVFIISILTLGLVISTFARSQFQAFQMTFMTFLPQLLLSGFMFPFEGMPTAAQWLSELFPLTHYLRIVRGIVLRDAALNQLTNDLWPLLVFFILGFLLATLRFQKRLD